MLKWAITLYIIALLVTSLDSTAQGLKHIDTGIQRMVQCTEC